MGRELPSLRVSEESPIVQARFRSWGPLSRPRTGGERRLLDDHLHDVPDPVYALLREVGRRAPDFSLPAPTGGRVRLGDLLEAGTTVVLVFYPLDFSPK